jgi:23S rRNA (guanosine2251-2'-O)-methyltransferase
MVVFGKHIFYYLLNFKKESIKKIYLLKKLNRKTEKKVKDLNIPVEQIDNAKAQSLSRNGNHQGILIEIKDYNFVLKEEIWEKNFIVVLYRVTDIGNIGSIVRTSYALGVDCIVVCGLKNLKMEGIIRRSSGAALDMKIALYFDINQFINEARTKGYSVYAASLEGLDIKKIKFNKKRVLILGSEDNGIPKKILKKAINIKIEMKRDFDSLNVGAAAAILIDRMKDV